MNNYVAQCKVRPNNRINFQILAGVRRQQKGAALITSLIFLILLTLLGFSASRGVIMQELISRNFSDQNLAFQAAEAALKYAEACIRNSATSGHIAVATSCTPGKGAFPQFPYADNTLRNSPATFWTATTGTPYGGSTLGGGTLSLPAGTLSSQPNYVIAIMNWSNCDDGDKCFYQISAWGTGVNPNTQKIVQSVYRY